jgi:membrane-bound ClpP family serine protease
MAAASFKPPSHWEDWCSWGLGIWLCISPWALRFELEPSATRVAVISGVLVILIEVITLSAFRAWEEWLNVLLGAWLIAAPWFVETAGSTATANFVVVGLLVLALALYELWRPGRGEGGA